MSSIVGETVVVGRLRTYGLPSSGKAGDGETVVVEKRRRKRDTSHSGQTRTSEANKTNSGRYRRFAEFSGMHQQS